MRMGYIIDQRSQESSTGTVDKKYADLTIS